MDSAIEAEFRDFVVARRHRLLRTAFLLTGDTRRAERLLQLSLVRAWRHWRRITRAEDPESYLLRAMVTSHASRRRQWMFRAREILDRRSGKQPEGEEAAEGIWDVLHGLSPRTRAVLVLRHYEELPEDDVAYLVGCSLATVAREERRGLHRLDESTRPEHEDDAKPAAAEAEAHDER